MSEDSAVIASLRAENVRLSQRVADLETLLDHCQQREQRLQLFEMLIERSIDGVTLTDLDGQIIYVNPTVVRMGGHASVAAVQGRHVSEFFAPEELSRIETEIIPHLQQHGSWQGRLWTRRADGSRYLMHNSSFMLTDDEGNPTIQVGFARDITEQYETEQRLEQQAAELRIFRALTEHAPDSIAAVDMQRRLIYHNDAFRSILGYDKSDELIGTEADDYYAEAPEKLAQMRQVIAEHGFWRGIIGYRRKDGTPFPGRLTAFIIHDATGRPQAIAGIAQDITEQCALEEELHRSQSLLQGILDLAPAATYVKDLERRYLLVNQRGLDLLQMQPDDIIDRTDPELFPDENVQRGQRLFEQVLATRQPLEAEGSFLIKGETTPRTFMEHLFPLYDSQGAIYAICGMFIDITSRKQAEDALREAHDELERRVQERTAALSQTNAALQAAIVEHQRTEAALRNSEARYRLISEVVTDFAYSFRVEPDGTVICEWITDAVRNVTGFGPEEFVTAEHWLHIIHPDDQPASKRVLVRYLEGYEEDESECRIITRSGETRWLRYYARPVWDAEQTRVIRIDGAARDITEQKQAEAQIQSHLQRLAALRQIDITIMTSFDVHLTLRVVLEQVLGLLQVDAASIWLCVPDSDMLTCVASLGSEPYLSNQPQPHYSPHDHLIEEALRRRALLHIADIRQSEYADRWTEPFASEGFAGYCAVPLITREQERGVLELFSGEPLHIEQEWLDFLEALAGQTAIAVDNAELVNSLQRANDELSRAYDATLKGWVRALDLRDHETEGHSQRVAELTMRIVRAMHIDAAETTYIYWGALLHDIGKIAIPDHILLKPGPLTEEEWIIMRQHPVYAYKMLSTIDFLQPALDIPHYHHERWDGTGYPHGLTGANLYPHLKRW
jgi:PAS domain S-box-containing protein